MYLFMYFEIKTSLAIFSRRFLTKHVLFDDEVFCMGDVNGVKLMELRFECDIMSLDSFHQENVKFAIVFEDLVVKQKHIFATSKLLLLKNLKTVAPFDVDDFVVYKVLHIIYEMRCGEKEEEEEICIR